MPLINSSGLPLKLDRRIVIASRLLYRDSTRCLKSALKMANSRTSPENLGIFGFSIRKADCVTFPFAVTGGGTCSVFSLFPGGMITLSAFGTFSAGFCIPVTFSCSELGGEVGIFLTWLSAFPVRLSS